MIAFLFFGKHNGNRRRGEFNTLNVYRKQEKTANNQLDKYELINGTTKVTKKWKDKGETISAGSCGDPYYCTP